MVLTMKAKTISQRVRENAAKKGKPKIKVETTPFD